ncbi:MAG: glycosyltransferase family 2 protein [Clostridiales Family XIII bacterium]|jgi:glycosyltransferase involved in cell wall biosynthesis|nr:glycosyltransferase family 2 protein [Clostridiales Family XIII bacterium]
MKISLIFPVYNEEEGIIGFWGNELLPFLEKMKSYKFEIIFIDDGSYDNTNQKLKEITSVNLLQNNIEIKIISFSKNYGKEIALTAGVEKASGDYIITADSDGQHPLSLIPDFINKAENGSDIVFGLRRDYKKQSFVKRVLSKIYNGAFKKITGSSFPENMTDFILINKKAKKYFPMFTERNRAYRYIIYQLGFKRGFLHYSPKERLAGKASYSFKKLKKLAVNIFVSQSPFLLYLFGYIGSIISILSFLVGIFIIVEQWILNDPLKLRLAGYVSLGVFTSFLCGLIMIALAMQALYINNINTETMKRPLYIIDEERSKL